MKLSNKIFTTLCIATAMISPLSAQQRNNGLEQALIGGLRNKSSPETVAAATALMIGRNDICEAVNQKLYRLENGNGIINLFNFKKNSVDISVETSENIDFSTLGSLFQDSLYSFSGEGNNLYVQGDLYALRKDLDCEIESSKYLTEN